MQRQPAFRPFRLLFLRSSTFQVGFALSRVRTRRLGHDLASQPLDRQAIAGIGSHCLMRFRARF